jgi:polysaccharide biosynthesis protein VpsM
MRQARVAAARQAATENEKTKMNNYYKSRWIAAMALAIAGSMASAQTSPVRPQYSYPSVAPNINGAAGVELGAGTYLFPYFNFAIGYDDNIYEAPRFEQSSNVYVATPGLKLQSRQGAAVMQLSYEANIGRFIDATNNNYVDQNTLATVDYAFSPRSFLRVGGDYMLGHDAIGSNDSGSGVNPNKYRLEGVGAIYAYGAQGAQGRVELGYKMAEKRYLNNPFFTASQSRDTDEYGGAFYWRVMPNTYLLAEARFNDYDYIQPTTPGDSRERRYYIGATWEATAKTSGTVKLGTFQKRYDNGTPEISESSWEAQVTWTPMTYSRFDFFSSKQPTESTGLGTAIIVKATGLAWKHDWNSKVSTGVTYIYSNDAYVGYDRTDEVNSLGLKVNYQLRRWMGLGLEYLYVDRNSNLNQYDYTRNRYYFTLGLTL